MRDKRKADAGLEGEPRPHAARTETTDGDDALPAAVEPTETAVIVLQPLPAANHGGFPDPSAQSPPGNPAPGGGGRSGHGDGGFSQSEPPLGDTALGDGGGSVHVGFSQSSPTTMLQPGGSTATAAGGLATLSNQGGASGPSGQNQTGTGQPQGHSGGPSSPISSPAPAGASAPPPCCAGCNEPAAGVWRSLHVCVDCYRNRSSGAISAAIFSAALARPSSPPRWCSRCNNPAMGLWRSAPVCRDCYRNRSTIWPQAQGQGQAQAQARSPGIAIGQQSQLDPRRGQPPSATRDLLSLIDNPANGSDSVSGGRTGQPELSDGLEPAPAPQSGQEPEGDQPSS